MFDKIKKWFNPAPEVVLEPVATVKKASKKKELTPKEKATSIGEPYISILSVELDPADINNGSFEAGDADFYYQVIRYLKPKKIIEIGSGHSTKLALIAINKNIEESKINTEIISIEPYENRWLENLNIKVLRKKIENINFDWHKQLSKNDILFIDSSHIIKPNGDILKIYLEIIPQLKSGVIIQIHDIFTPKNYLNSWLLEDVRLWNEQYILEALLINNNKIEIISALNFLKNNYYHNLKNCCPYLTNDKEPASIYLRIT